MHLMLSFQNEPIAVNSLQVLSQLQITYFIIKKNIRKIKLRLILHQATTSYNSDIFTIILSYLRHKDGKVKLTKFLSGIPPPPPPTSPSVCVHYSSTTSVLYAFDPKISQLQYDMTMQQVQIRHNFNFPRNINRQLTHISI
jgi:hypothetical protein